MLAALAVALLAALAVSLTASAPAAAAASCSKKVIDDWYDDGRVDGNYPLHCYDDAIDALPPDVRDYSSAKEDIERALQARMQGEEPPPATGDPSPGDPTAPPGESPPGEDGTETDVTGTPPSGPTKPGDDEGVPVAVGGDVDTASSSAVPVPLLVLAGLALLLVAAGSIGYLTRRLQARRVPPTA